jgi:hypothetical protein
MKGLYSKQMVIPAERGKIFSRSCPMIEPQPTTETYEFYHQQFLAFISVWREHRPCLPLEKSTIRASVILFIDGRHTELLQILDGEVSASVDANGEVIFRNERV